MKLTQEKTFTPITITFELEEEEVRIFWDLVRNIKMQTRECKELAIKISNLFSMEARI